MAKAEKMRNNFRKINALRRDVPFLATCHLPLFFTFFLLAAYHLPLATLFSLPLLHAQVDLYPFPTIEDAKTKKPKEAKPVDPFVRACSRKMNVPENILSDAIAKGFGRTEIIRLILISKKAQKPLENLINEREKGARLAKIAGNAQLNNRLIRAEATSILKELENEEAKIKAEIARSTTATAGIGEMLTKNATNQAEKMKEK